MYPHHPAYQHHASQDSPTTTGRVIRNTSIEIQSDRGILYVYREDGMPLLKITGLPRHLPDLVESAERGHELNIEVIEPHEAMQQVRYTAAISMPQEPATESTAESLLKQAGATLAPHKHDEH
jgi:hypothetical protein